MRHGLGFHNRHSPPPPAPPAGDPNWSSVTLLLPGNGTNGAQNNTFLDGSTNNFIVTRNGNTTQGTFTPYGSNWSNYFDGTGDYLDIASAATLTPSGDFTIEFWTYPTQFARNPGNVIEFYSKGAGIQVYTTNGTWGVAFSSANNTTYYINTTFGAGALNQWQHVAVYRSGNSYYGALNGVVTLLGTSSSAPNTGTDPVRIGDYSAGGGYPAIGYISNVRYVNGTAVYGASNFTPPTAPLTAITNTSLLTCQSNRFRDASTNNFTITRTGDVSVSRFSPFSPTDAYAASVIGGSGYLDGNGDFLTVPSNAAFQFGTGDFTIECWINKPAAANGPIVDARGSATAVPYAFYVDASNFPYFYDGASYTSTVAIINNQWNHVAVVRTSNTLKIFVNGVEGYSNTVTTSLSPSATVYIGGQNFATPAYTTGYISSLRVVKGTAVYTAAFTPPTAPLTAITNTSLLLNFTNAGIIDNAMLNDLETVGNAQISTAQSKFGGSSMLFDGTGDWLVSPNAASQQLDTGNFTIEGWLRLSATGVAYGIVSKGTSTTGWSVNVTSGNKLQFSYTATQLTGATSIAANTWYHFAVVRNGSAAGNLVIYLDGVADATSAGAVNDNFNQTSVQYVGASRTGTDSLNGYIDDLRITKGVARYTANFTPPAAAFPLS